MTVWGDAGCAAMMVGAPLQVVAAPAAAAAGRMEAISLGCGLGTANRRGMVAIRRPGRPTWSAAA